jgi:hypothetical protein
MDVELASERGWKKWKEKIVSIALRRAALPLLFAHDNLAMHALAWLGSDPHDPFKSDTLVWSGSSLHMQI